MKNSWKKELNMHKALLCIPNVRYVDRIRRKVVLTGSKKYVRLSLLEIKFTTVDLGIRYDKQTRNLKSWWNAASNT